MITYYIFSNYNKHHMAKYTKGNISESNEINVITPFSLKNKI